MSGPAFYVRHSEPSGHPFILYTSLPPNNGDLVTEIAELNDKTIRRTAIGLFSNIPSSHFRFAIELDDEEEFPVTNDWTLVDIAKNYPPWGWESLFLHSLVELEYKDKQLQVWDYYPEKRYIFRAFEECPFHKLKVVLLGQDPYHSLNKSTGLPDAVGLSFASHRQHNPQPSLRAIYQEIRNSIGDVGEFTHADLTKWARQGILLLNSALTVEKGKPKSHTKEWKGFVRSVFRFIQTHNKNCIYILLGRPAQDLVLGSGLMSQNKRVITAGHPSPENRGRRETFFNTGIFTKVNQLLREDGKTPIDWNID